MKNITKESIKQDLQIIEDMLCKYSEVIYEKQEGQLAHFDKQSLVCKLCIGDVSCGLSTVKCALDCLSELEIIED